MKEQQIQKKIIDHLEDKGHYVVKVVSASKRGVPDLLVCLNGVFVGIEVKKPETRDNVSKLQDHNLRNIRKAGGVSFVATCVEDVEERINVY